MKNATKTKRLKSSLQPRQGDRASGRQLRQTANFAAPDAPDQSIFDFIDLNGVVVNSDGSRAVSLKRRGAPLSQAFNVPLVHLASSHSSALEAMLTGKGILTLYCRFTQRVVSRELLLETEACHTRVVDKPGCHEFEGHGAPYVAIINYAASYPLNGPPNPEKVVLVGDAARTVMCKKSTDEFNRELSPIFSKNPRVLNVVVFALAAQYVRAFGRQPLNMCLTGMSSKGKTTCMRFASYLVDGTGYIETPDATPRGFIEALAKYTDRAAYVDDLHGKNAAALVVDSLMTVGSGGSRKRSGFASEAAAVPAPHCTLIFNGELTIMETTRAGKVQLNSGIFARVLEVGLGEYGVFDDIGDHPNSAALAKGLQEQGPEYAGFLGKALLEKVAPNWTKVQSLWAKHCAGIRVAILKMAGAEDVNDIDGRVLDGLVFVVFIGCLLEHFKVVNISKKDVKQAAALVFRERLERTKTGVTPVAQQVIEAVRTFIQANPGKFLPSTQAGCDIDRSGIAGFKRTSKAGEVEYRFFPGIFRGVVRNFGSEAYVHLRSGGFLSAQAARGNMTSIRMPSGQRQDFVVISGAILASEGDPG